MELPFACNAHDDQHGGGCPCETFARKLSPTELAAGAPLRVKG
jgi:hypothetical protein